MAARGGGGYAAAAGAVARVAAGATAGAVNKSQACAKAKIVLANKYVSSVNALIAFNELSYMVT